MVRRLPRLHLLHGHPVVDDRGPRRRRRHAELVPGRRRCAAHHRARAGGGLPAPLGALAARPLPRLDGVSVRAAAHDRSALQHRVQADRRLRHRRLPRRCLVPAEVAVVASPRARAGRRRVRRVPDGQDAVPHLRRQHRFDDGRRVRVLDLADPVPVRPRFDRRRAPHRSAPGPLGGADRAGDALPRDPRPLLPAGRRRAHGGPAPTGGFAQVGVPGRPQRRAHGPVVVSAVLRPQRVPQRHGMGEARRRAAPAELGASEGRRCAAWHGQHGRRRDQL